MSWGRKVSPGSGRGSQVIPPQRDLPGCGGLRDPWAALGPSFPRERWGTLLPAEE